MSSPLSTLFILPILSPSIFNTVVLLNLKSDFVSPVLSVLHWVPISARVNTKVLTMVSQTLCDLFSITSLTHFLLLFPWLLALATLAIFHAHTRHSLGCNIPSFWNTLPSNTHLWNDLLFFLSPCSNFTFLIRQSMFQFLIIILIRIKK